MAKPKVTVWDLPLRLWHWLFAVAISTALATGLVEELYSIEVHQWSGITIVALLAFRLTWGLWGATYARWTKYRTTPQRFLAHFRRQGVLTPHTSPGIVLVLVLMLAAVFQSVTGLFMTDDIFFEGPLFDLVDDPVASWVREIHLNAWRVVVVAVAIHLLAHLVYGIVLRDPTPLSMVTGQKDVDLPPTVTPWMRALLSLFVGLLVFVSLAMLAD